MAKNFPVLPVGIGGSNGGGSGGGGSSYTLPAATANSLGGVKVGTGLDVANDGTLSVSNSIEPAVVVVEAAGFSTADHYLTFNMHKLVDDGGGNITIDDSDYSFPYPTSARFLANGTYVFDGIFAFDENGYGFACTMGGGTGVALSDCVIETDNTTFLASGGEPQIVINPGINYIKITYGDNGLQ